jgi:hypothetical protein
MEGGWREDGGRMEGGWREDGGRMEGGWREDGGSILTCFKLAMVGPLSVMLAPMSPMLAILTTLCGGWTRGSVVKLKYWLQFCPSPTLYLYLESEIPLLSPCSSLFSLHPSLSPPSLYDEKYPHHPN